MEFYIFAFAAVICSSLTCILFKHAVKEHTCEWSILILFHAVAIIILTPFVEIKSISLLTSTELLLLLVSSICWVCGDLFGVRALKYMEASVCEAFGTMRLILIALVGVIVFNESFTLTAIVGITLIITGVLAQMRLDASTDMRGVMCMLTNAVFIATALSLDKILIRTVPEETILFYGFLLPTILYASVGYKKLKNIVPTCKEISAYFLLSPLLGLLAYYYLLIALANGSLTLTYTIQETAILFVLLFEILILQARHALVPRVCCCVFCSVGAMAVCLV